MNHTIQTHPDFVSMLESIDLEVSGYCNAECTFCPRDKMTREKALLSETIFDTLLAEVAAITPDGPDTIYFCGLGESLLNKNVCIYADRVNDVLPDTFVVLVSNGSALNKETCDAILTGGIYT